jgi:hypothetical protein
MDGYSKRSLGIYAGAQEILAAPDYFDYAAFWRINCFFQRICVGAFYLHPVLNL